MATKVKIKKEGEDEEGDNVSRTGRQRKKSAKVLEMEAEAEELAQVLRARVDNSVHRYKQPPGVSKGPRVRKKSAKLIEMVEVEGMDRSIFRKSHLPKSIRNPVSASPSPSPAPKKLKPQTMSPTRITGPIPSSPPGGSPSAIKQLLTGPVKKTPAPTSPPPEPILSTLGAALTSPIKTEPGQMSIKSEHPIFSDKIQPGTVAVGGTSGEVAVKFLVDNANVTPKPIKKNRKKQAMPTPSLPATGKPLASVIGKALAGSSLTMTSAALAASQLRTLGSPIKTVVSPLKPSTTPSKPPATIPKSVMPKLKNLLSPPKKLPPGVAVTMADQPVLSKMMDEVGQLPQIPRVMTIGPPPPSTAEAKSMKKKAKKDAAAALKGTVEIPMMMMMQPKKIKKEEIITPRHFMLPLSPMAVAEPDISFDKIDDNQADLLDDDEEDHLMIDTSQAVKRPKKSPKKGPKPPKVQRVEVQMESTIDDMIPQVVTEEVVGMMDNIMDDIGHHDEEEEAEEDDEEEEEEEEEEDLDDDDVDIEVPTHYANTNVMANKVQTSTEKKANKEKKKGKKGKKDEPDKERKKRGPTAYMLWCNAHRQKLVKDNPGIDFATISRRLGEMWSGQSEKEKMVWKRKAKKLASKGSTVISTGKGVSQMVHGGSGATLLNRPGQSKSKAGGVSQTSTIRPAAAQQRSSQDSEQALSPHKANGCSALDVAAHLKLLGESLSIIGARLQEHHGQIAVQGTLPVLLDSLLCALGPLSCLTTNVPQLDGAPLTTHAKTLDNIAYIMPGIG